jgi:glycosyl transferase family 25
LPHAPVKINQLVDAVYVLSVRTFDDRIAHMRRELGRRGIEFEFVFEHDANAIPAQTLDRVFAPSDLSRAHQSLVLKHIETWRRCVERGHARVLVFEDDAVLARGFEREFARAMAEADSLPGPYLLYLGRGDNRYIGAGAGDGALVAGGILPATDALVFDRAAAERRLAWLASNKVARTADWMMREIDAAVGIPHFWLRNPVVEQGSMNGLFDSVLDNKRRLRGRWYAWLRYRWDKWWRGWRQSLARRPGQSREGPDGA